MSAADTLLAKLENVRRKGSGWMARCPAHADRANSLSIDLDAGKVLLKCFAGCTSSEIVERVGLELSDLFEPEASSNGHAAAKPATQQRRIVKVYDYQDASGEHILHQTVRYEPKGFAQRRPDGKGDWIWNLNGITPVLYNLPWLGLTIAGDEVWITSGEKDADRLQELGLFATTNPLGEGPGKWHEHFNELLRDKHVIVPEDNDETGRQHVLEVAQSLHGTAASIKVLRLPGLPEHGDVADWLDAGHTKEELQALADGATAWEPAMAPILEFPKVGPEPGMAVMETCDRATVVLESPEGDVRFTFSSMEAISQGIEANMVLDVPAQAGAYGPMKFNIQSTSTRDSIRREMEAVLGKKFNMAALLAAAVSRCASAFLTQDRSIRASELKAADRVEFAIDELVVDNGVTIPFGAGGSLKTYWVMEAEIAMALGDCALGFKAKKKNVLHIDYGETGEPMFGYRLNRLLLARGLTRADVPNIHFWHSDGIPFHDQVDALRAKIEKDDIGVWVLDHIGVACGGEPEKASTATQFYRDADKLGRPGIALAHITGEGTSDPAQVARPFGSIFWLNGCRRAWYTHKAPTLERGIWRAGLYNKKQSDGDDDLDDVAFTAKFENPDGAVYIYRSQMAESSTLNALRGKEWAIWEAINDGEEVDNATIAERTGLSEGTIRWAQKGHPEMFEPAGTAPGKRGQQKQLWRRKLAIAS